jgi:hypothetical protein
MSNHQVMSRGHIESMVDAPEHTTGLEAFRQQQLHGCSIAPTQIRHFSGRAYKLRPERASIVEPSASIVDSSDEDCSAEHIVKRHRLNTSAAPLDMEMPSNCRRLDGCAQVGGAMCDICSAVHSCRPEYLRDQPTHDAQPAHRTACTTVFSSRTASSAHNVYIPCDVFGEFDADEVQQAMRDSADLQNQEDTLREAEEKQLGDALRRSMDLDAALHYSMDILSANMVRWE